MLAEVSVRPVRDGAERAEWDRLMDAHHSLGLPIPVRRRPAPRRGDGGRAVGGAGELVRRGVQGQGAGRLDRVGVGAAVPASASGGEQHALPDPAGAERRQPGVAGAVAAPAVVGHGGACAGIRCCSRRPSWIRRGSRAPATSRRTGTVLGDTRGYARDGGGWTAHGAPKRVLVRALGSGARAALRGLDEPASWGAGRTCPEPPAEDRLRSLHDFLREVPEYRSARGVRHRLATVLAVAVAAKLAGAQGATASPSSPRGSPGARWRRCARSATRPPSVCCRRRSRASTASFRNSTPTPWTARCAAGRRRAARRRGARARRQVEAAEPARRQRRRAHDDRRRRARQRRGPRPDLFGQCRRRGLRRAPAAARTRHRRPHSDPRRPASCPKTAR